MQQNKWFTKRFNAIVFSRTVWLVCVFLVFFWNIVLFELVSFDFGFSEFWNGCRNDREEKSVLRTLNAMQCKWSISIFIGTVLRMRACENISAVCNIVVSLIRIRWFSVFAVIVSISVVVVVVIAAVFMQLFSSIRFSHFPHECPLIYSVISTHHAFTLAHTHTYA